MRIIDAGERLDGRPEGSPILTSGNPRDNLRLIWRKPDFAGAARSKKTSPERAALFEAVYMSLAPRPAPVMIDGMAGSWPPLWRGAILVLKSMWESGIGSDLSDLRTAYDAACRAAVSPDIADIAPLAGGRLGRRDATPKHPFDIHPAIKASAKWLPRLGWPNEDLLSFERCYGAIPTKDGAGEFLQLVEIRGRSWSRIGSGARHQCDDTAFEELKPLAARLLEDRRRDEAVGVSDKALGPGGVRIGPPNPKRVGRTDSKDLVSVLKLKGVEFGRGILQRERREVCDLAFDAMFDLCQVLRMPAPAASLWGRAGLAFGSRGMGPGVLGHFEPKAFVVHMDGWSGAGVLAHEFGHALDSAMAHAAGLGEAAFLSEGVAAGWREDALARMLAEVYEACIKDRDGLPSSFLQDSRKLDGYGRAYWATPVEMFARAFECWVHDALKGRGRRNDFLVARAAGENVTGLEFRALSSVYPKGEERRAVVWKMDRFLKVAMPLLQGRLE